MNRLTLTLMAAILAGCGVQTADAGDFYAVTDAWNYNYAQGQPWHGSYYYGNSGQPLALVVPPTAHMRQTYAWGVSQNTNHPIYHQYRRSASFPGAASPGQFAPTPVWPSHTDQFGVYYVRGPW